MLTALASHTEGILTCFPSQFDWELFPSPVLYIPVIFIHCQVRALSIGRLKFRPCHLFLVSVPDNLLIVMTVQSSVLIKFQASIAIFFKYCKDGLKKIQLINTLPFPLLSILFRLSRSIVKKKTKTLKP